MQPVSPLKRLLSDNVAKWSLGVALAMVGAAGITVWLRWPLTFEQGARILELLMLGVGLQSLILLWAQNRAMTIWNSVRSYHDYFQEFPPEHRITELEDLAERLGFLQCLLDLSPIPKPIVEAIESTRQSRLTVRKFLDDYEEFCAAVNARVVDPEYAYGIEGTRVIRVKMVFEPLISRMRAENRYTRCYLELMKLGDEWKLRREAEARATNNAAGVQPTT